MKMKFLTAALLMTTVTTPPAWGQATPRVTDGASTLSITSDGEVEQLTAQQLRNKPVYDRKSEKIATISEVTGTPGQMRQAILYTGGVLGVGGREVALPLDKLGVAADGRLVLTISQDQLKLLPKYR